MKALRLAWMALCMPACLAACAISPFSGQAADASAIGPADVASDIEVIGQRVIWGGVIVGVGNLADHTEIEVAALPLDRGHRPREDRDTGAHFLVIVPGFVDPATHAPERLLSVFGTVDGVRELHDAGMTYRLPVVDEADLHLWPEDRSERRQWRVGIGVQF